MNRFRRRGTEPPQGLGFEQVQDFHQLDPAGAGEGHGNDLVVPVGAEHRGPEADLVALQIVPGDQPVQLPLLGEQSIGHPTGIKTRRPPFRNGFQGSRQVRLPEQFPLPVRRTVGLEEGRPGGGKRRSA